jgi:hypothetical protein
MPRLFIEINCIVYVSVSKRMCMYVRVYIYIYIYIHTYIHTYVYKRMLRGPGLN